MWGRAHTPFNSKLLAGATQLNEMAFAVREATTELMYAWKELYSLH